MGNHKHSIREEIGAVLIFIGVIWAVFLLDRFLPLEYLGLAPRDLKGLIGIVTMPFLHANFAHLMSNTTPLIVLLTLLAGSRANSKNIVIIIILLGGAFLWLMGRGHAIHIGASSLVFGLATFLIMSGILEKRTVPLIVSVVVALFYGTTLISGVMPGQHGVSWDGHLLGGIAGVVTAFWLIKSS